MSLLFPLVDLDLFPRPYMFFLSIKFLGMQAGMMSQSSLSTQIPHV